MSMRLIALAAGVLAVVLAVAGCGGSSSAASISKAEFTKKADVICEEGSSRILADYATYSKEHEAALKHPTEADYTDLITAVLTPNSEQEIEEIRELGAPKGDEGKVNAMLKAQEESIEKAEADPEGAIAGGSEVFAKPNKDAKEYGLQACSE